MYNNNSIYNKEINDFFSNSKDTNLEEIMNNTNLSKFAKIDDSYLYSIGDKTCLIGITKALFEGYKELHHHEFNELLYIKKGYFKFKVDDKVYNLEPGDLVIVTPSTLHVLEQKQNIDCEKIVINVTDSYIEQFETKNTNLKLLFDKVNKTKNYCIRFRDQNKYQIEKYLKHLINVQFSKKYAYYDTFIDANQVKLFGRLSFPIYYGVYEAREYFLVEKRYSKEQVVKIFNENLSNYYRTLIEKGVQILEKNVKIEHNANEWVMKGTFVIAFYNSEKEYRELLVENIAQ